MKNFFYIFIIIFLILIAKTAKAEGICHINNCFVPAPTIVLPANNQLMTEIRPAIQGLTWKRTLVDIYLDGQYQGAVKLKEHENHLQSFFWQPPEDLSVGQHFVFTIAYSTKGYDKTIKSWDESKESAYIYFTIERKEIAKINKPQTLLNNKNEPSNQTITNLFNAEKNPTTKPAPEPVVKKTIQKRLGAANGLDIIGWGLVGLILISFIVNKALNKKRQYLKNLMAEITEEDYPPPPPPLNQNSLGI